MFQIGIKSTLRFVLVHKFNKCSSLNLNKSFYILNSISCTTSSKMKLDRNSHDYKILLKTIYGEARHESRRVQLGVAWVILNRARLNKSYWGGCSIADVCQCRGQFECWKIGSFHMYDRDAKKNIEEV